MPYEHVYILLYEHVLFRFVIEEIGTLHPPEPGMKRPNFFAVRCRVGVDAKNYTAILY